MNEFDLIKTFFNSSQLNFPSEFIDVSIGDDCAVLDVPADQELCISADTLIENVHFPAGANAYDIGTRSLCVTLSDLAAMGAKPIGFTLAISLPSQIKENSEWLKNFSDGLAFIAQKYHCPLIGGDTTKSSLLTITIQVHGITPKGKSLKRSGARVGDLVCVSASHYRALGDAAGALPLVLADPALNTGLAKTFWQPLPQIELGVSLIEKATSCLDVSDGLVQDLNHICSASQVSMELDVKKIPLSEELLNLYSKEEALKYALAGGDDYQLAFTVKDEKAVLEGAIQIGRVVQKSNEGVILPNCERHDLTGFSHF